MLFHRVGIVLFHIKILFRVFFAKLKIFVFNKITFYLKLYCFCEINASQTNRNTESKRNISLCALTIDYYERKVKVYL